MPIVGLELNLVPRLQRWSKGAYRELGTIAIFRKIDEKVLVDKTQVL